MVPPQTYMLSLSACAPFLLVESLRNCAQGWFPSLKNDEC
ncbi:hypothetical protein ONO86_03644 [Micromonospora noduli]|nr:hypothetical protein ONO86_03644 [Micromonospora noduli]